MTKSDEISAVGWVILCSALADALQIINYWCEKQQQQHSILEHYRILTTLFFPPSMFKASLGSVAAAGLWKGLGAEIGVSWKWLTERRWWRKTQREGQRAAVVMMLTRQANGSGDSCVSLHLAAKNHSHTNACACTHKEKKIILAHRQSPESTIKLKAILLGFLLKITTIIPDFYSQLAIITGVTK